MYRRFCVTSTVILLEENFVRIYENQLNIDSTLLKYLWPDVLISKVSSLSTAHDSSRRFTPSYNDRPNGTMAVYSPTLEREEASCRAAITRKCLVFYIFALERAVESDNRVLENQLLVTVRGRCSLERAVLFFFFSLAPFLCAFVIGVP